MRKLIPILLLLLPLTTLGQTKKELLRENNELRDQIYMCIRESSLISNKLISNNQKIDILCGQIIDLTERNSTLIIENGELKSQLTIIKSEKNEMSAKYNAIKEQSKPITQKSSQPKTASSTQPKVSNSLYETYSSRCQATTQKGAQCKRTAAAGRNYCWQH